MDGWGAFGFIRESWRVSGCRRVLSAPVHRAVVLVVLILIGCAGRVPDPQMGPPVVQEFQFQILNHQTPRQYGRTINLWVRYRYGADVNPKAYPDYRDLRRTALQYLKVRPNQPANEYWEVLNEGLARKLYQSFSLEGVVCQLQVHPDPNPKLREPGWHSSIVTIGTVSPISGAGMIEAP